jgi:hypothetical protein
MAVTDINYELRITNYEKAEGGKSKVESRKFFLREVELISELFDYQIDNNCRDVACNVSTKNDYT